MSNRRISQGRANTSSAHPALIALARLLGRQAALETMRTGALLDDPEAPSEFLNAGSRGTEEQDSRPDADASAEAGRGRSLSRNLEEDADAPRGSRRGPRKAGK